MNRAEAYAYRKSIEEAAALQSDEKALENIYLYPKWEDAIKEKKMLPMDMRLVYGNKLWKVINPHIPQDDWKPDTAVSLFVEVSIEEWPEWKQPIGSTDAYRLGAKVTHNDKHWESIVDNNVWEPGVYGWKEV